MAGVKKVIRVKNQFFHARQPREEIFEFVHTEALFSQLFG